MRTALLLLLAACNPDPPSGKAPGEGADSADTSDPESLLPDLPTSACGGPPYDWVPLDQVGQVVASEADDAFSLPAATIDTLLAAQGYADFTPVPYGVKLYKVRYTTQDRGERIEATGYAAFPDVAEPTALPMLLWAHPTMGFSDACAPTALGLIGAAFPVLFAAQGYVVAAPDYIGMNGWGEASDRPHAWIVGEPTAIASLDMARATVALGAAEELPASADLDRIVVWGASQGGHAALFIDRYAPGYAPELTPAAVVALIPPTNPQALAKRGVTEWSETTAGLAGFVTAANRWYPLDAPLSDVLVDPFGTVLPEAMDTLCEDFGQVAVGIDSIEQVWTPDFVEALLADDVPPPWDCAFDESSITASPVPYRSTAPVLLVTGEDDDLAWAPAATGDVGPMCDLGYTVEHVECAGADHVSAAVDTLRLQLRWIEARLAGEPVTGACEVTAPIDCEAE